MGDIMNNNIHSYREGLRALIDWVAITVPVYITMQPDQQPDGEDEQNPYTLLQKIYDLLQIPGTQFVDMKKGLDGYKRRKDCGHIKLLYDGTNKMGTHIIISGQGCREYEQRILKESLRSGGTIETTFVWKDLFTRVLAMNGHFTRLDAAIDDFTPYFTLDQIEKRVDAGLCSSKFDRFNVQKPRSISDGKVYGHSIEFGSKKSDMQIIMYDKILERIAKKKDIEDDLEDWIRTEIRLENQHTYEFVYQIVSGHNLGTLICRVLKNYISFWEKGKRVNSFGETVDSTDSNKSRGKLWRNWAKYLGSVDGLKLKHIAPDRTIEKSMNWIETKVKKSLARVFVAEPETTVDWLMQQIVEGSELLDEMDENMIHAYLRGKENIVLMNDAARAERKNTSGGTDVPAWY